MTSPYGTGEPERVDYGGKMRAVIGRLTFPEPPEPGTVIAGPPLLEFMVVLRTDGGKTLVGRAIVSDMASARERTAEHGPASPTERRLGAIVR